MIGKNLNLKFGLNTIYEDANFIIPYNSKVGIVGLNGCGKTTLFKVLLKEMVAFFVARIVSLGIDMAGMYLLLEIFKFGKMPAKIIVNVIVIVANYVFSKLFVFRKDRK